MSTKDDGGPAFPLPMTMDQEGNFHHSGEHPDRIGGMTRRQLYAGMAMAGDWAAADENLGFFANDSPPRVLHDRARLYWRMADALLATEEVEP